MRERPQRLLLSIPWRNYRLQVDFIGRIPKKKAIWPEASAAPAQVGVRMAKRRENAAAASAMALCHPLSSLWLLEPHCAASSALSFSSQIEGEAV